MSTSGVPAALVVLLLVVPVQVQADAGQGRVSFWKENVTMSCPDSGTWFSKDDKQLTEGLTKDLEVKHENTKSGFYYCKYSKGKYYFYIKGKVCDDCFELDTTSFGLVIIIDICITTVVMMMVYRCTKTKTSAGFIHPSKAPAYKGGRGPIVPSPDYEYPNPNTRSQDIYSKRNGM